VQKFVNTTTGTTHVVVNGTDFGEFSNQLWPTPTTARGSTTACSSRGPIAHRSLERLGNYTLQINNDGTRRGGNEPAGRTSFFPGFYPELFNEAAPTPSDGSTASRSTGPGLDDLRLGVAGREPERRLLYRFDSGQAYSVRSVGRALTSVQQAIGHALYPICHQPNDLLLAGRGRRLRGLQLFDLALTIGAGPPDAQALGEGEMRNMFNSTPSSATTSR